MPPAPNPRMANRPNPTTGSNVRTPPATRAGPTMSGVHICSVKEDQLEDEQWNAYFEVTGVPLRSWWVRVSGSAQEFSHECVFIPSAAYGTDVGDYLDTT